MKKFKIVACINNTFAIGKDNKLLYCIPNDMANFRRMTTENVVVMGRKTFESLPRPLPNRANIVLSTDSTYKVEGYDNVFVVYTIAEAINLCEKQFANNMWFVIGGSSIYSQFLAQNLVDEMFVTIVDDDTKGDSHFPNVFDDWKLFYESGVQTNIDGIKYRFAIFKR